MGLTNEHVGPKILAKIKIYVLTRAELLFQVCYEIPCSNVVGIIFRNPRVPGTPGTFANRIPDCSKTFNIKIYCQRFGGTSYLLLIQRI